MLKAFLKGLGLGALLAGSYALLKTPHSGETNRRILKDYSKRLSGAATDLTGSLAETQVAISDLANQGMQTLGSARDDIQLAIRDFQRTAVPQMNRIQEQVAQLQADVDNSALLNGETDSDETADKEDE
ncbi:MULTISPECIES: YtxH domain-containing protein [Aerococcus]|uniref:YtxH domain-containing protein n=1 Tax=Aerococcus TaxID=1375 RepID=UPI0018E18F33|nr:MULTISPECIES: YtxH domain-containing protein [Aerococcus]MCY3036387.1 YtxH domain-containing protein [Aerococcus sp. Group 2]MCY3039349.1 YtxH domain-containing protein [Aerococcus sp. Group 2]MCY3041251.1 YtxH domain-containing protein [Aerococcus sp. Group 2]MCY3042803.1 YtxH domain-containing protein [Aerococcus sp. Group 2]MDK6521414.1 YtxH domain-containing protein [Aerococcus urinae]